MKKISCVLLLLFLMGQFTVSGQDFSNKGKDFWVGYSTHVSMYSQSTGIVNTAGGSQNLVLYFTSEQNANVTVEIPSTGWKRTYSVIANSVTESVAIPKTGADDVRLATEGKSKKGIHITSDVPIVAYAHNYDGAISGATLLFPTNTLGKDYYVLGFTQTSNSNYSYPFCFVIATEDNTVVEITPSANTQTRKAGVIYYDTLQQGEILNLLGQLNGASGGNSIGVDLTGTRIRSVSGTANSCKKIAVFCGTGKLNIRCGSTTGNSSADNTIQQAFPSSAWGKKYVTIPTKNMDNNFFRVMVNDSATIVKLNGSILSGLTNNRYYQFQSNTQNIIEADQPVIVSQYITTANSCGNTILGGIGDPEMIYLSPVEQTINHITLNSTTHAQITVIHHYINVAVKTSGINSFSIDGVNKSSSFVQSNVDKTFSYAQFQVTPGIHTLNCDTGFNATAYGYGSAESYGYNAGTSIRDFTPVATFQNPFNRIDSAVTCVNTPLQFSVPLSFQPTTIQWDFSSAPGISPNANIVPINTNSDSTKSLNGQTLYYYSTKSTFLFTKSNSPALRDTIKMYTTSATPDGCGSNAQTYAFPVIVKDAPIADFKIAHAGCLSDSVIITDQSNGNSSLLTKWQWNFGDGTTTDLTTAAITPKLYSSAGTGSYDIKLKVISEIGCVSAEKIQTVKISPKPVAKYTVPATPCVNDNIVFTDASTVSVGTISKWTWRLDTSMAPVTNTTNAAQTNKYTTHGVKDVWLQVESATGCKSDTFRITPQFKVNALPEVGFVIPEVCLNDASALFTDTTKMADGATNLTYLWDMNANTPAISPGPNPKTSTVQNPSIKYNKAADYKVSLTVTSNGCVATLVKDFTVNGANPAAAFEVQKPAALCSNDSVSIKNKSTVDFGNVTRLEIFWDANDLTKKTTDESPYPDKVYSFKYPDFQSPATKTYTISLKAYSGNAASCSKSVSQTVTVNASPKVAFVTMPGICNEAAARQITQASFDAQVPGTFSYTGTAVSSSGLFNPQTAGVGTFLIKYTYTSAKSCQDTASKPITVWPSPVAKWSVTDPLCQRNDLVFKDSSVANFSAITQRIWNYDDGSATITRTNGNNYTQQFAAARTYAISLQVLTDSGCKSTVNVQSVKINYLPRISFSLPEICLPDGKGQFTNQSTIDDGSEALFSYLWAFNDPNDPSPSTLKEPVHKYSALGPYNVQLRITTKDGCVDSLTKSLVTIYPQPKAAFTANPAEVCLGDMISFTETGNAMGSTKSSWLWNLSGGTSSTVQNPTKQFNDSGTFTISYYFFNAKGCVSDTVSQQVIVHPYPILTLGPSLKILEGGQAKLKPKYVYGTALQYLWTPSLYLSSDTAATPVTVPADDITYKLTLTGIGGCSVSDTIFIKVLHSPEVPNVFSPNGDGINDTWRIKYLESYPGAVIEVYDRFGQIVFYSVGYDVDWDGTYKGKSIPIGTYYFIIDPKNGKQRISGSVTIIK